MYYFNKPVRLLKIGRSGNQLKLSIGKECIDHMRCKPGDQVWFGLFRDRHLILTRYESLTGDEEPATPDQSPPMWRLVRVEIRGSYRRCTIPSVFGKLLNLTAQDYLACFPIKDGSLHAWPVRKMDILALDPLSTTKGSMP